MRKSFPSCLVNTLRRLASDKSFLTTFQYFNKPTQANPSLDKMDIGRILFHRLVTHVHLMSLF